MKTSLKECLETLIGYSVSSFAVGLRHIFQCMWNCLFTIPAMGQWGHRKFLPGWQSVGLMLVRALCLFFFLSCSLLLLGPLYFGVLGASSPSHTVQNRNSYNFKRWWLSFFISRTKDVDQTYIFYYVTQSYRLLNILNVITALKLVFSWIVDSTLAICCSLSFSCMSATILKIRRVAASCFVGLLLACLFVCVSWLEFNLLSPYAWHLGSLQLISVVQFKGSKYRELLDHTWLLCSYEQYTY